VKFKMLSSGSGELSTHFRTLEEIEEKHLMEASTRSNMRDENSHVVEFQSFALV
jgi:hypothetical protein